MVPSNVNSSKVQRTQDTQDSQKTVKPRRRRRPKSKPGEILPEPPAQASTSVIAEHEQPKAWQWVSITEPPTTKHPPVFTKDGG